MSDFFSVDPTELSAWGGHFGRVGGLAENMGLGLSSIWSDLVASLGTDEPSKALYDAFGPQLTDLFHVTEGFRDATFVAGDGIESAAVSYAATERHVFETVQFHKPTPPAE